MKKKEKEINNSYFSMSEGQLKQQYLSMKNKIKEKLPEYKALNSYPSDLDFGDGIRYGTNENGELIYYDIRGTVSRDVNRIMVLADVVSKDDRTIPHLPKFKIYFPFVTRIDKKPDIFVGYIADWHNKLLVFNTSQIKEIQQQNDLQEMTISELQEVRAMLKDKLTKQKRVTMAGVTYRVLKNGKICATNLSLTLRTVPVPTIVILSDIVAVSIVNRIEVLKMPFVKDYKDIYCQQDLEGSSITATINNLKVHHLLIENDKDVEEALSTFIRRIRKPIIRQSIRNGEYNCPLAMVKNLSNLYEIAETLGVEISNVHSELDKIYHSVDEDKKIVVGKNPNNVYDLYNWNLWLPYMNREATFYIHKNTDGMPVVPIYEFEDMEYKCKEWACNIFGNNFKSLTILHIYLYVRDVYEDNLYNLNRQIIENDLCHKIHCCRDKRENQPYYLQVEYYLVCDNGLDNNIDKLFNILRDAKLKVIQDIIFYIEKLNYFYDNKQWAPEPLPSIRRFRKVGEFNYNDHIDHNMLRNRIPSDDGGLHGRGDTIDKEYDTIKDFIKDRPNGYGQAIDRAERESMFLDENYGNYQRRAGELME